jgi:hypothetical protein
MTDPGMTFLTAIALIVVAALMMEAIVDDE